MEFRILGPLEVCDEAGSLPLGGAKQRALLAILLLHANEVVSAERLLEELRTSAVEQRVDADLALGRHAELVGELESLAKEHPLRERLRGQLMLALYRSGRQVEALAAYQESRRALIEELGIEPGKPLRE